MKNKLLTCLPLVLSFFLAPAFAADQSSLAIAMVAKGQDYLKKHSKDALIHEVNNKNPDFVTADTYLTIRGIDGTQLAHPVNPKLVGKNMLVLADADGKLFRKEIVDTAKAKGKGWVDYSYNNPATKQIEKKSTYFEKNGDIILEAGIYKGK